jgi:16S rRNA (cytidine1402-2'-O)-methyltransferase
MNEAPNSSSVSKGNETTGGNARLYVVATPIGNRKDITLRALEVLGAVDLVAAEDTRTTGRFLAGHGLRPKLVSYHEHNAEKRSIELLEQLKAGASIALVSDAGTPTVSDPGYRLVRAAIAADIAVVPIPGVSAAVAALSVSGLATDAFVFLGFLSKKAGKRREQLMALVQEARTMIFYESPKRISALLTEMLQIFGPRKIMLSREMTKRHEEFFRGTLSAVIADINYRPSLKGECTLVVAGADKTQPPCDFGHTLKARLDASSSPLSEIARQVALEYGLSKKSVYQQALKLREKKTPTTS